jgi:hypothetical protein
MNLPPLGHSNHGGYNEQKVQLEQGRQKVCTSVTAGNALESDCL